MDTVGTHLNKHKEIPVFFSNPLFDQLKTLFGHRINLAQQVILVIGTEVWDVDEVVANGGFDLLHNGGRIGIGSLRIFRGWREKTSNLDAIHRSRWIGLGHTNSDNLLARTGKDIPYAVGLHSVRVRQYMLLIRVVSAIAKPVEPKHTRVLTRHHRAPGWNRNCGNATFQLPPHAVIHYTPEVRKFVAPLIKNEFGRGAI